MEQVPGDRVRRYRKVSSLSLNPVISFKRVDSLDRITGEKSVVLDVNGDVWQLYFDYWYAADQTYHRATFEQLDFLKPFTVLVDTTN